MWFRKEKEKEKEVEEIKPKGGELRITMNGEGG